MSGDLLPDQASPELKALAEKFCLQTLTEPENRQLNELLRQDQKARSFLLAYASIHARLSWEHGPALAERPVAWFRHSEAEINHPEGATQGSRSPGSDLLAWVARYRPLLPRLGWTAVVLTFLLGILAVIGVWRRPSTSLALLTRSVGAQTTDSRGPIQPGQPLGPGRLSLDAGTVEVTIRNGVRILLEGPAALELLTPMRAYLHAGQAVVHVPQPAIGFVLETRGASVLDLGTEFGVKVGSDQSTDVQVYQGSVITTAKSSGGKTNSPHRLLAGSAARINPDAPDSIQTQAFAPERFVRQLPKASARDKNNLAPANAPRLDKIHALRPARPITINADLSEWNQEEMIRGQCEAPFGEAYAVKAGLMYDPECLYIGAHIADPAPMRSLMNPATDGDTGWRGGGLQLRVCTDRALGWPVDANAEIYYQTSPMKLRPQDSNEKLVHLTLWHYAPNHKACLNLSYGMDFHGVRTNPEGYRAAFRKDPDGRGYTLEYAIPWALLNAAQDPPRMGDTLAATLAVHWSDDSGRLWRGQLIELHNPAEPLRKNHWDRAVSWGRAVFQ